MDQWCRNNCFDGAGQFHPACNPRTASVHRKCKCCKRHHEDVEAKPEWVDNDDHDDNDCRDGRRYGRERDDDDDETGDDSGVVV
jgi:hypothetical protein